MNPAIVFGVVIGTMICIIVSQLVVSVSSCSMQANSTSIGFCIEPNILISIAPFFLVTFMVFMIFNFIRGWELPDKDISRDEPWEPEVAQ